MSLLLIAAAATSVLVALLHVHVIVQGPEAYRFFGAGEQMASLAEQGSWIPPVLTAGITVAFLVFAAYYLSAAQLLPPLPYLKLGMLIVAGLYTLRGVAILPLLLIDRPLSMFEWWSSWVALGIGLLHIAAVLAHDAAPLDRLFVA